LNSDLATRSCGRHSMRPPQILVDVINEMLVVRRGRELGYKLSDDQFNSVVDDIKKKNNIENEQQLQALSSRKT